MPRTTKRAISWLFWLVLLSFSSSVEHAMATETLVNSVEVYTSEEGHIREELFEPLDRKWSEEQVPYCVSDSRLEETVKLAFEKWSFDPYSSFDVSFIGSCDRVDIGNRKSEIGFWKPGDQEMPENPFLENPFLLGLTSSYWYVSDSTPRRLVEADVLFRDWPTVEQIQVLVQHELGHFAGLPHSDNINSVMYRSWNPNSPTQLTDEDFTGIRQLYPRIFPASSSFAQWRFERGEMLNPPTYAQGVYLWDGRKWRSWYPNVPSYVNSFKLESGKTYWVLFK